MATLPRALRSWPGVVRSRLLLRVELRERGLGPRRLPHFVRSEHLKIETEALASAREGKLGFALRCSPQRECGESATFRRQAMNSWQNGARDLLGATSSAGGLGHNNTYAT